MRTNTNQMFTTQEYLILSKEHKQVIADYSSITITELLMKSSPYLLLKSLGADKTGNGIFVGSIISHKDFPKKLLVVDLSDVTEVDVLIYNPKRPDKFNYINPSAIFCSASSFTNLVSRHAKVLGHIFDEENYRNGLILQYFEDKLN
jgi:hypothetical protein